MIGPTTITTPEGVTLTIPRAWTTWTFQGRTYRQIEGVVRTGRRYWNGRGWDHVAAGRFLGVL